MIKLGKNLTCPTEMYVGLTVWRLSDGKRFTVKRMRDTGQFAVQDMFAEIELVTNQEDFTADPEAIP